MKPHAFSRLKAGASLILLLAAPIPFATYSPPTNKLASRKLASEVHAAPLRRTTFWHAGNFRYLDAEEHDLLSYVDDANLSHPNAGLYGRVSPGRTDRFNVMLDALFAAIDASLADGNTGDWCDVKGKAAAAGYEVIRFYDTVSGRWFVHGRDKTQYGQAYFFINPFAKRNLIIEVPHAGTETDTALQGARIFKDLAARALIINKERRCSDPDEGGCNYGTTSPCNGGPPRQSDMAHNTDNTFTLLHARFNADAATNFAQLHGFAYSTGQNRAVVGDGTTRDGPVSSVSVTFASLLRSQVNSSYAWSVVSCQEAGTPNPLMCGETNVQGRFTDGGDACAFTTNGAGRFLHIEQALTLRDDVEGTEGMSWRDVSYALKNTWPNSFMNNGATDDTLGPAQTEYGQWTCPAATTTLSAKVTFYGWPDNDDGNNNYGTNVIACYQQWQGHDRHRNSQSEAVAGGVGTFADPVTVAAGDGNSLLPPGTLIYVTGLKKYFLVEDVCRNCTSNWVDLWMESNDSVGVEQCESNWTGDVNQFKEVRINPASNLAVDTTPFFNTSTHQCNPVTW
jgi:3D (Asp-Asp-Asp) domain-containing protein